MNPILRLPSRAMATLAAAAFVNAAAPVQAAQVQWAFNGRLTGHDAWPGAPAEAAAGKLVMLVPAFENETLLKHPLLLADGGHRHPYGHGSHGSEDILSLFGSPLQAQAGGHSGFLDRAHSNEPLDVARHPLTAAFEQDPGSAGADWRTELELRSTALATWAFTTDKRKPQR